MKKILLGTVLLLSIAAVANQNDLVAKGLKFIAPGVKDRFEVYSPEEGEIIYQSTDKQHYGYDGTSWNKLSAGESVVPTGVILPFGGTAAPSGFLMADGAAYLIADHPELYTAIGTAFGDGTKNASGASSGYAAGTAFNVPDMRGRFMRGVDGTANRDPDKSSRFYATYPNSGGGNSGNLVGSIQPDQFASHNHGVYVGYNNNNNGSSYIPPMANANDYGTRATSSTGGNETRPKNINVNYIIKR